jgi:hypothetical protein
MAFWNKLKNNKQTLSDIMRGMQHSVNTAQEILEKHHIHLLNKYFSTDGNPRTKTIQLGDGRILNVPLISVINQNSLVIDEMEIEFKAKVNDVELKHLKAVDEDNDGIIDEVDRTSFAMDFAASERGDNHVLVKIKFKTKELPEGVSRIVDEFDKEINPIEQDINKSNI